MNPVESAPSPTEVLRAEATVGNRQRRVAFPRGAANDAKAIFSGAEYPVGLIRWTRVHTVIDVGAHVGLASLYFHLHFPEASIHAFEPIAANRALFQENLGDDPQVTLHPYGLGDRDERRPIFYARRWGLAASSVVRTRDHDGDGEEIALRSAAAAVGPIADEAGGVSILKIDTEGFEYLVLQQLQPWLSRTDVIFLEIHSDRRRRDIDALVAPHFDLRQCSVSFLHRIKALYVNRESLRTGRIATAAAPEIFL